MGAILFIFGAFAAAGTIEQGGNPTVAIIIGIIGLLLMVRDMKKSNEYSVKMDRSTRLRYLP